jgi:putative DNA primase/helicase
MSGDSVEAFRDWARATCGVLVPADLPIGKIVHCQVEGKPSSNKAGRAKLHLDGIAAGWAQNWTDGTGAHTWRAKREADCSPAERAAYRAQVQAMQREREAAEAQERAEAAIRARAIWAESAPCESHPYLTKQKVKSYGLRLNRDGRLIVPAYNADGNISTLQFIDGDKTKRFLKGARKTGCWFTIGEPTETICVCEGYGTGASIYSATGYHTVVAFDTGNLLSVSETIRTKHPAAKIILCADNDTETEGNPGLTAATRAAKAVRGLLAVPTFGKRTPC